MTLTELVPYLTGPAGALIVLAWVVWTQRKDLAELHRTVDAERRRADSAEEAARTSNALIAGLLERTRP